MEPTFTVELADFQLTDAKTHPLCMYAQLPRCRPPPITVQLIAFLKCPWEISALSLTYRTGFTLQRTKHFFFFFFQITALCGHGMGGGHRNGKDKLSPWDHGAVGGGSMHV